MGAAALDVERSLLPRPTRRPPDGVRRRGAPPRGRPHARVIPSSDDAACSRACPAAHSPQGPLAAAAYKTSPVSPWGALVAAAPPPAARVSAVGPSVLGCVGSLPFGGSLHPVRPQAAVDVPPNTLPGAPAVRPCVVGGVDAVQGGCHDGARFAAAAVAGGGVVGPLGGQRVCDKPARRAAAVHQLTARQHPLAQAPLPLRVPGGVCSAVAAGRSLVFMGHQLGLPPPRAEEERAAVPGFPRLRAPVRAPRFSLWAVSGPVGLDQALPPCPGGVAGGRASHPGLHRRLCGGAPGRGAIFGDGCDRGAAGGDGHLLGVWPPDLPVKGVSVRHYRASPPGIRGRHPPAAPRAAPRPPGSSFVSPPATSSTTPPATSTGSPPAFCADFAAWRCLPSSLSSSLVTTCARYRTPWRDGGSGATRFSTRRGSGTCGGGGHWPRRLASAGPFGTRRRAGR